MNGLLQRLAERTLGVAPVVRPFVPSRFAPEEPGGAATGLELDRTMEVEARRPPALQAPPRGAEPPVHGAAHPSDGDPPSRQNPGGGAQTGRAAETAARGSSSTEPPLVAARAAAPPAALTPSPPSPAQEPPVASEAGPAQRVERQGHAAPARTGPIDPDALLASETPLARDDGAPTRRVPPSDAAAHAEPPVATRTAQPPAARPGPAPTPHVLLVPLDSPPDGRLLLELGRSPSHPASPSGDALAPVPAEIVVAPLAPARAASLPGAAAPPVTPALARPALPPVHRVEHDPFTGSALLPAAATAPVIVSRPEAAPPPIRVTIGRVEVRAVLPAAEPRRPVPPPAQPPISLDEYLRQRDRGHR